MSSLQNMPYVILLSITRHLVLAVIYALQLVHNNRLSSLLTHKFEFMPPPYIESWPSASSAVASHSCSTTLSNISLIFPRINLSRSWIAQLSWLVGAPQPALNASVPEGKEMANGTPESLDKKRMWNKVKCWYKVVETPPDEEVDWLSPITVSYTLCATKQQGGLLGGTSGCWYRGIEPLRWMEFERRIVYFTIAKVLTEKWVFGSCSISFLHIVRDGLVSGFKSLDLRDDEKVIQFGLIQIYFPEQKPDSEEQITVIRLSLDCHEHVPAGSRGTPTSGVHMD